jgi:mono/diheme cytochrome c family protein
MAIGGLARRCLIAAAVMLPPVASANGADLVEQGRQIFFTQTFGGNGRTCGSCHPADNNYTIDPAFIARLPKDDPLLAADFLDDPLLLRKLGLVTVHADGFDRPGVQRGVPTLLGIARSLTPDFGAVGNRTHAVGWSGDGVPEGGSLRDFATGAVREHMAQTPARVAGVDFRPPTAQELRALAAFMRSLGRGPADELELGDFIGVNFRSPLVETGRQLFNREESGSCALCHRNGTALNEGGFNGMLDVGVQRRRDTAARRLRPGLSADGGFGRCPPGTPTPAGGCGDGRFNTPSLIEAADTVPSFHDNSAATIEDSVRFYTTPTFANSPEGQTLNIRLTSTDIVAIAALLRTLNAIENIRSSNLFLGQALGRIAAAARPLLRLAVADTDDAVAVLTGGPRQLYAEAVTLIRRARLLARAAALVPATKLRDYLLRRAIELQSQARDLIYVPAPAASVPTGPS